MRGDLSREELERLAAFAFGFVVGLIIIGLAASLVEEWIVQSDLADRRRVREIVKEELAALDQGRERTPADAAKRLLDQVIKPVAADKEAWLDAAPQEQPAAATA